MQVAQLYLPLLSPEDMSILGCVCSELQKLRVSWEAYGNIHFTLSASPSAISWLHKNIVSIKSLFLEVTFNLPTQLLQGLVSASRRVVLTMQHPAPSASRAPSTSDTIMQNVNRQTVRHDLHVLCAIGCLLSTPSCSRNATRSMMHWWLHGLHPCKVTKQHTCC